MKESWLYKHGIPIRVGKTFVFKMRVVLLSLFLLQGSLFASAVGAQQHKVTLQVKDKELLEVVNELRRQTGLRFFYSMDKLKAVGKVSVDVKDGELAEVLDAVLSNTGLTYQVLNDVITIKSSEQQQKQEVVKVIGKVTSKSKEVLPGVTIQLKGYTIGTSTDENGEFTLSFPKMDKPVTLLFSFVGMKDVEVAYTGQKTINVTMEEMSEELESVVVTGYSNIKSSSFTGNAVTVKKEDLLKASKSNVIKALQTFDPSFRIKQSNVWGSDPNALPEVYIRGESGVGVKQLDRDALSKSNLVDNPNLPVFIMDGFEISVSKLYDMDPSRIESITILKDAAATALYGSRAANGVVVITSVTPKAGKLNVAYNFVGDVTFPDLTDYDLLNAKEKLEAERLAGCYTFDPADAYTTQYDMDREYNKKLANVLKGVDTYWLSKPLETVFNHRHSVYVDGGSDNVRFGIELQYANQDGVMKGSLRDRLGAAFYLQYNYKSLTIKNQATYQKVRSEESPYGDFADYAKQLPYDEFKNENGGYLSTLTYWGTGLDLKRVNPLYEPSLHNYNRNSSDEFINNLSLNWYIVNGLLLKGQLSLTKSMGMQKRFYDPLSKLSGNKSILSLTNLVSGTLYRTESDAFTLDMNATLSYNKTLGNHMINALAGVNMQESTTKNESATYVGFPSGTLSSPEYANDIYEKPSFSESTRRIVGYLLSLNYSFKDIYLLDASMRVDGSSVFGSDKRYAPFWSAGVGINIHKYAFMRNVEFINQLKIRGSFGQTGKANFPAYAARSTYEISTDRWYKTGISAKLKALGNTNLTWETTNTIDVGAEVSLFDDRFYIKGAYYSKRTIDLINDVTVPTSTGFRSYRDNIGEVSNKGCEFDLRIVALNKQNLQLIFNANLAHNKNRIEKISESLRAYNERVQELFEKSLAWNDPDRALQTQPFLQYVDGGSLSSIWGVRSMGINPADGQEVFVGKNGQLTRAWNASDQVVLGTKEPKVQGSFGFNLVWKQWSLYSTFMYEAGGQQYNQTLVDKVENVNVYTGNVDRRVLTERWKKPGDNAKYKSLVTGRSTVSRTKPTSRFVEDYNMLQWSSMELGYDVSKKLLNKIHLNMLRLTFSLTDIMHLSSVKQERGTSYPFARTVSFSLKLAL